MRSLLKIGPLARISLVIVCVASLAPEVRTQQATKLTAIRFGMLLPMNGPALRDAVVVVAGDRVQSVGREVPANASLVDLRRFTGLPGLVDVHVHLNAAVDRRPEANPRRDYPTAIRIFLSQDNARRTVATGVTTVRSMTPPENAEYVIRDLINLGLMVGPRVVVGGQMSKGWSGENPEEARALAFQRLKAGADWIKVFGSAGSGANVTGTPTFTCGELKSIVEAAHSAARRVAVHAYGPDAARNALCAGADSIEHAVDVDDETLEEMAKRGTFYVPTVDHNRYYIDHANEYGFSERDVLNLRAFIDRNVETLRRAVRANVPIAMGSDAVYTMFGENTQELRWFVKAGMTPENALRAATIQGAKLLGMPGQAGEIVPGAFADLVAVEGDPRTSVEFLIGRVRWVMKSGTVVHDVARN